LWPLAGACLHVSAIKLTESARASDEIPENHAVSVTLVETMAQAIHARLNAAVEPGRAPASEAARARAPEGAFEDIRFSVHEDLGSLAAEWQAFERDADGTVFQTYEWLACWQRHVGTSRRVRPAIVLGRDGDGLLFLLPLSVCPGGFARTLEWLGSDLCDYNGLLLAPRFAERVDAERFRKLWAAIAHCLQHDARFHYDVVRLTKMPERVGGQPNPLLALGVTIHPSGAYLTQLAGTWDEFYTAKRSSSTRRRDRTKRKRLGDLGTVNLVTPEADGEIVRTLDLLMEQKARSFARMGVANLFANPGYAEFYRALATEAASRPLAHVSRLDVGDTAAAINLGLVHRGRYYHLLASYDDGEVSRFGPGAAHLHDLMQYAIEHGCSVFDFTIGDEGYKRDWSDTVLTLYDHVAAASLRGTLVALPLTTAQRLKRWIKQTPALWALAARVRAVLGKLRR
jgi:CelD/BcsL family acetyltransferase involved in cellulose biosynthesis